MNDDAPRSEAGADPRQEGRHQEFSGEVVRREDLDEDPLLQFRTWLAEAGRAGEADPFALTLSTIGEKGAPSSRIVDLKDVDHRGFVFTTSFESPKAKELDRDPRASLVFYWPVVHRQVRAQGIVSRLPGPESGRYFRERPRGSRLALHVFVQGLEIRNRGTLLDRFDELERQYADDAVPMPNWGGFVLDPSRIEFWKGHSDRLHDRIRYERSPDGSWIRRRLAP